MSPDLALAGTPLQGAQHVQDSEMTPSIACGIAIVMVEHLPVVADYWSDAFYRATFTRAEIADCLLQEQPLVHLAARWCAKKALQKCDPVYLQTDLCLLEVRLSARGAPYLCAVVDGYRTPLAFAVSLSHTTQAAVAVVVEVPTLPGARGTDTPATAAEAGGRWHSTWLPLLMGHS